MRGRHTSGVTRRVPRRGQFSGVVGVDLGAADRAHTGGQRVIAGVPISVHLNRYMAQWLDSMQPRGTLTQRSPGG